MFAPNISTHRLADEVHRERLSHAALLQKVARERTADDVSFDRAAQRRITSRRIAATVAGAILSFSIAAVVAANQPDGGPAPAPGAGGGLTLIR